MDESFTKERLDWILANLSWLLSRGDIEAEALTSRRSDHLPILFSTRDSWLYSNGKSKLFHFEAKWIGDPDGENIIIRVWQNNDRPFSWNTFQKKLKQCNHNLTNWHNEGTRQEALFNQIFANNGGS